VLKQAWKRLERKRIGKETMISDGDSAHSPNIYGFQGVAMPILEQFLKKDYCQIDAQ